MGFSTSGEFTNAERTKLTNIEALADVTDSVNVDAANAVMDADFSGARGFMEKASAGVYDLITSQELNADIIDIIRQMHPNVSMMAAMSNSSMISMYLSSDIYKLMEIYDNHNDNSVDVAKWTITTSESHTGSGTSHTKSVTEAGSEYLRCYTSVSAVNTPSTQNATAYVTSDILFADWQARIKANHATSSYTPIHRLYVIGASTHYYNLPNDGVYYNYRVYKDGSNIKITKDGVVVLTEAEADATFSIRYYSYSECANAGGSASSNVYVDETGADGAGYGLGLSGNVLTDAIAANAAVLSFFSHLKGKYSNGGSTHTTPVGVEIFGNGDAYAASLNATTKFKIDVADPRIELYRTDDSEVAKSNDQTDWVLDDNVTNGAFPTKTTSTHETILAEEIGCASVVMVEKSVNGAFTDTEILIEDDDYTVDYSTRTATKIVLTSAEAADIVISQSKLRITWIADVEDIEGTANTALKMKIHLNRTAATEASPEIQKIDIGTDKYAEMQYLCG